MLNQDFCVNQGLGISQNYVLFCITFPNFSLKILRKLEKTWKKEISTCILSVHHPSAGQNIQQLDQNHQNFRLVFRCHSNSRLEFRCFRQSSVLSAQILFWYSDDSENQTIQWLYSFGPFDYGTNQYSDPHCMIKKYFLTKAFFIRICWVNSAPE